MKAALTWFVIASGIYDLVLGLGLIVASRPARKPRQADAVRAMWTANVTLAYFLIFAGVLLVWAAVDLETRGPAVAWQGLVRLGAATSIFYAISRGYTPPDAVRGSRIAAWIDVFVAIIYFYALIFVWHWPALSLILGRSSPDT